jgi:hypothetical protein
MEHPAMATDAVQRQPLPRARQIPTNRTHERIFFALMTFLVVATILLGFRASYFPVGERPAALASVTIILHAAVFTLFLLLFVVQTTLVAAHRVRWHMRLGLWLYGLAALMVPLGLLAAADELRRDVAANKYPVPGVDARTFSMISVMGVAVFAVLMAWSYLERRNPAAHKRFALYAVLSMMNAGTDRWPWQTWGISESWSLWVFTALLILPAAYDLISLHRLHWSTLFSAPFIWLLYWYEFPLGRTHAWHTITDRSLKFMK